MKRLSTFLIIAGLLLCLIPIGGRVYMHYTQDRMYDEYLAELELQNDTLNQAFKEDITTGSAVSVEPPPNEKSSAPPKIENVIGTISLPAISSSQLLLEGSGSKQLKYGAGHVTGTASPGESGNCSIAGHRNYTFGSYFNRLDEVNVGDTVSIQYNNSDFTYTVTESLVVTPEDVSVLANTDSATITLITCHPKGSNTHRLIVKGVLQ